MNVKGYLALKSNKSFKEESRIRLKSEGSWSNIAIDNNKSFIQLLLRRCLSDLYY